MPRKIRVGVIFGGRSAEHDVSLRSAEAIMAAIDRDRFEVVPIGITREGRWLSGGDPLMQLADYSRLPLANPATKREVESAVPMVQEAQALDLQASGWTKEIDVLFPVLHGPWGEDGTIQGMFELANVPYVGSGVLASSVGMDKITSKLLFERCGLPIAPWISILRRDWKRDPEAIASRVEHEIGYPCFTKPANLGSSLGIAKVHHAGELAAALDEAARYDRKIVIERGLNAREFEVSVLGNDDPVTSVVGEVVSSNEFYDFDAKYVDDRSKLIIPATIVASAMDEIRSIAARAFKAIDAAGLARVDFFMERDSNRVYLNEINTIPGFTQASMYPLLWEASGLSFQDLVTRLVELAVERHSERSGRQQ